MHAARPCVPIVLVIPMRLKTIGLGAAGVLFIIAGFGSMWLGASLGALLEPICSDPALRMRSARCTGPLLYTVLGYVCFFLAIVVFVICGKRLRRKVGAKMKDGSKAAPV